MGFFMDLLVRLARWPHVFWGSSGTGAAAPGKSPGKASSRKGRDKRLPFTVHHNCLCYLFIYYYFWYDSSYALKM